LRASCIENRSSVNLAHAGVGSASHLCGLMLQNAWKAEMTTVPYKCTGPAMTDLMGGTVDPMCEQATNAVPQIEGDKVKAFASADEAERRASWGAQGPRTRQAPGGPGHQRGVRRASSPQPTRSSSKRKSPVGRR
jgi:hypothetical protein